MVEMEKIYKLKKGEVCWTSPSNIALIKYWGKKGFQIPANPSLSITLSKSLSKTTVHFKPAQNQDNPVFDFYFEGEKSPEFAAKIKRFFNNISQELPFINLLDFTIHSENTFPHSAGIASSASAMSALSLCLCSIEQDLIGHEAPDEEIFLKRASNFARIGSGSASRSVFGKMASWGKSPFIPGSSNLFASPFRLPIHPIYENYMDTILIVSKGKKGVSSSAGHELMENNPFSSARFTQANTNLGVLIKALENGNLEKFVEVVETEALTLHAMMMASMPGYMLMKPNTLEIINKIKSYREQSGILLCFTLDAGPNVHILYPRQDRDTVFGFINEELKPLCENGKLIDDKMGEGPKRII